MTTYYTYDQEKNSLTAVKRVIYRDGQTIILGTAADFARYLNAYPLCTSQPAPTPPDGKIAVFDRYEQRNGEWIRTYRYEDAPPPPPRVYDKYELVTAIERAGFLEDFVSLIRSDPVLELKWNAADYLDFSDGTLQSAIDAIKESLGVTDEQVEAVLAQAEIRQ